MSRLEIKAALSVDDAGTITGIAWPFGSPDRVGDVIEKGAFASPARLPMLWAHDQGQAIGVWDSITERDDGLHVKGRLLIDDVARAREVRALVREGAVTGLSIGFVTRKAAPRHSGGRTISRLDLHEISIVPVPSHPDAQVSQIKGLQMKLSRKELDATEAAEVETIIEESTLEDRVSTIEGDVASLKSDVAAIKGTGDATEKTLRRIEVKMNRPGARVIAANENSPAFETKALNRFLRNGRGDLDSLELKTLNLGTGSAGGYAAAPEYSAKVIEKLIQFSPLRSLASVMSISKSEIYLPKTATHLTGNWVTETGLRPTSEPSFEQINIKVFEHAVTVPMSVQLLEDAMFNIAEYVSNQISQVFGKVEAAAFITGDGNGKPTGLLHTPADFAHVEAEQDGSDIIAKVIEAFYKLPSPYAANGSWLMTRRTMGIIRAAADTTLKGNLWSDSLANGTPATLLGRPVYESIDMDELLDTDEADTYPIAFGDFASAYQIVDRVGIQLMRDDYTGADNGIVKIRARRRVGGKTVLAEPVVLIKATA